LQQKVEDFQYAAGTGNAEVGHSLNQRSLEGLFSLVRAGKEAGLSETSNLGKRTKLCNGKEEKAKGVLQRGNNVRKNLKKKRGGKQKKENLVAKRRNSPPNGECLNEATGSGGTPSSKKRRTRGARTEMKEVDISTNASLQRRGNPCRV